MTLHRVFSLAALGAFLVGTPMAAEAQNQGRFQIEARGGVAMPTGDLNDVLDPGATFGAKLAYMVTPTIGLRADADIAMMRGAGLTNTVGDLFDGPDMTLLHYSGGVQFDAASPASRWSFVLNGGAGATTFDADAFQEVIGDDPDGVIDEDFNETFFTANGGLQLGYDVSRTVNAFVGAQAYVIFADEEDTQVFADLSPDGSAFETVVNVPVHAGFVVSFP